MFENFKNKNVLIFGLGRYREGSGISAALFFLRAGAKVTVTDMKTAKELGHTVKMLKGKKVTLHLGGHRLSDVRKADLILRNPGVPSSSPYLKEARMHNIPIMTDVSVFMKLCPCLVIGVTGTRGKSTTTALLGEMISQINKKTFIGGNIQRSPLTFLDKLDTKSIVVLEISSWLAESLEDIKQSPHGAIVTNIYRDHLNIHGSMTEYIKAKENIFRFQKPGDVVVLNLNNPYTKKMEKRVPKGVMIRWFSKLSADGLALKGEHNRANAAAASTLASAIGVPSKKISQVLKQFRGLPNRQEIIRIYKGITWINDTTATTPEAVIAALRRFGNSNKSKRIILIVGGADKKLEFSELAKAIKKYCKAIILFEGTATTKLHKQLGARYPVLGTVKTMSDAVKLAKHYAQSGDIVALSPAAASFGLFKNEFDRGEQFVKFVRMLK